MRPDPTALRVRPATAADLEPVAALHTRAHAAYDRARLPGLPFDAPAAHARHRGTWERALAQDTTRVLCAERHGTVLGAACYGPAAAPHTVTLHQLHIDPAHWRTGVGGALHTACRTAWRSAGHHRATLEVLWHNRRARAFYAAHGWHPDPLRAPAPDATHLGLVLSLVPRPGGR